AWWRVRGRTLTIHLRRVAPDFVQRLALPYFCAVPPWAPNTQRDNLPSAGPFFVARYNRGRSLLLERNPYYHGPRRVHARAIVYALDRQSLARFFGKDGAIAGDEYLPPGCPGYERKHIYPVGAPDLRVARRLAEGHLRSGHATFLACGSFACVDRALIVAQSL